MSGSQRNTPGMYEFIFFGCFDLSFRRRLDESGGQGGARGLNDRRGCRARN
jgi:hypothetical protein